MVTLAEIIMSHWPTADLSPGGDVTVSDFGDGQTITHWDAAKLGPQPTLDELEAFRPQAEAAAADKAQQAAQAVAIAAIQAETDAIYSELPVEVQSAFAPIYVAAKDFILRGKIEVAASLITAQEVPPELEASKSLILSKVTQSI